MGNIYNPSSSEGAEWCNPVTDEGSERFRFEIDGTPRGTTWKPLAMKLLRKALRRKIRHSDAPWHSTSKLIFRESAIEKMKPILDTHGELLPLECPDAELWVFNPTIVLDALDEQASIVSRSNSGQIFMIDKHVFHADVVAGVDVFKVASWCKGPVFVSDRFVDLWNASGLRGLEFKKLWSSE
jgi:hypothetical protein